MAPHLRSTEVKQGDSAKGFMDAPPCLPVIDLAELGGPQHDQVMETLLKAAEKSGFFQVVNHGMSIEFLEEVKESVYRFFNQSEEKKSVYCVKVGGPTRPLVRYAPGSWPEPIDILNLTSNNEHEPLEYWPDCCKEVALKFQKSSGKLGESILHYLMSNLGVTLDESMVESYIGLKDVSLNYYPTFPCQNLDIRAIRPHTDPSILTVLLQDHVGGLFGKLNEDGDLKNNYKREWVEVKPIPGALTIILGDMIQVLSNGKYKSCEHYVQSTGRETRVSIPVFLNPRPTTKIGPLPQLVDKDGGKPQYSEFLYDEYTSNAINKYVAKSPDEKSVHSLDVFSLQRKE